MQKKALKGQTNVIKHQNQRKKGSLNRNFRYLVQCGKISANKITMISDHAFSHLWYRADVMCRSPMLQIFQTLLILPATLPYQGTDIKKIELKFWLDTSHVDKFCPSYDMCSQYLAKICFIFGQVGGGGGRSGVVPKWGGTCPLTKAQPGTPLNATYLPGRCSRGRALCCTYT